MTKQEAEELAKRLGRIWAPEQAHYWDNSWRSEGDFFFKAKTQHDTYVFCHDTPHLPERQFCLAPANERLWPCRLVYVEHADVGMVQLPLPDNEDARAFVEQFTAQWLPFFRRCCWLSGCPIEASAHEKTEWMQGFTREELQSWKLNF